MVYSKENYRFDHFLSSRYRSTLVRMVVGGFLPFRFVCLFACLFCTYFCSDTASPFLPKIRIHILHTVLYMFPKLLTRRTC